MKTILFACAAAAATLSVGGPALAQGQSAADDGGSAQVEQVVVTGKLEEELPTQLAKQGVRVDVVDAATIKNAQYVDVAQALQTTVPGLYIAPKNGPFDYVRISLQGSRTQDVLWLEDGVRLNNRLYGGTTPLDTLPASMVERIEVVEGPQALFYGTQSVSEKSRVTMLIAPDTLWVPSPPAATPTPASTWTATTATGSGLAGWWSTPLTTSPRASCPSRKRISSPAPPSATAPTI